jgi:hypothetical protein
VDGVERCADRAAAFVSQHHEERRLQVNGRVLDAAHHLGRDDVARHPDHEQLPQPRVEDQLRGNARIAAAEDRRIGPLRSREVGEPFLADRGKARLASDEAIVAP